MKFTYTEPIACGASAWKEAARPFDAGGVLRRIAPAAVNVDNELDVAAGEGGRVGRHALICPPIARRTSRTRWTGSRLTASRSDVDRGVGQLLQVVGLPVVARAGGQQRIECLLPADERMRADEIADRRAERRAPAPIGRPPSASGAGIAAARGSRTSLAVPFRRAGTAAAAPGAAPPRRSARPARRRRVAGIARITAVASAIGCSDQAAQHLRADRMQLELEARSRRRNCRRRRASPRTGPGARSRSALQQRAVGGDDVGARAGCRRSGRTCG